MNFTTCNVKKQNVIPSPINGTCPADRVGTPINPSVPAACVDALPFWNTLPPRVVKGFARSICSTGSCKSELSSEQSVVFEEALEAFKAAEPLGKTWKDLETHGHFGQNEKIQLITADTLVVGNDVASNKFNWRAFDHLGIELTTRPVENPMTREGFDNFFGSLRELAVLYDKKHIVVGIEPTSHYWFNLYRECIANGMTVIMVNPFAVNRIKEVDDNLQVKSDDKDPKVISRLSREGAFSVPYLSEGLYADMKEWDTLRERALEVHTRLVNQTHRWMDIYFPEIKRVYDDIESPMLVEILSRGYLPKDLVELGEEGILSIFEEKKARGCRAKKAKEIYNAAVNSIGRTEGLEGARQEIRDLMEDLKTQRLRLNQYESKMVEICKQIYPHFDTLTEVKGITDKTLASFLADIGDMSRFDSCDEIVKISGLAPVIRQSGKYKGIPKISKRGRKRMRHTLFILATSVTKFDPGFKECYTRLVSRENNPLKHKQAMMNISTKLIRVIRKILKTGETYDPAKLIADSKPLTVPKANESSHQN